jgi:hypothetical protein
MPSEEGVNGYLVLEKHREDTYRSNGCRCSITEEKRLEALRLEALLSPAVWL